MHHPLYRPGRLFTCVLAGAAVLLTACGPDYLVKEKFTLPPTGWTYADSLSATLTVADTTRVYDLLLDIRHTPDYPFQNLYVRIHTTFPDGNRLSRQVSLELADKTGLWQGDCGGRHCAITIPIQEGAYFNQRGEYIFTFEQYMRRDSLPGLETLAFKVKDTGRNRR